MVKGEEKNLTIENFLFRTKFEEEDSFKMIKAAAFDGVDFSFHKEGGKALDFSGHTEKAKRTKALLDKYELSCEQNRDAILKALADYGFEGDMNLEVIHSFDRLPSELYPEMLEYIAKVGRHMINKFNQYKEAL